MEELINTIGPKLRSIRLEKKLTIKQVSERTNLTKSLISQIENGKITPSLRSLLAIAKVLDITIGSFFDNHRTGVKPVVQKNERKVLSTKNGVKIYLLTPDLHDRTVEFLYVVYDEHSSSELMYSHRGQECGIVLKGKLEVLVNQDAYILKAGDSIAISSHVPHRISNIHKGKTEVIWVNSPPL